MSDARRVHTNSYRSLPGKTYEFVGAVGRPVVPRFSRLACGVAGPLME